jgi:hypothetical protein
MKSSQIYTSIKCLCCVPKILTEEHKSKRMAAEAEVGSSAVAVQIYVNLYLNILLATAKRVSHLFTKRVEILKT